MPRGHLHPYTLQKNPTQPTLSPHSWDNLPQIYQQLNYTGTELNDGRRRDGRKDGWVEGALGGREGQRRANADSSTVRACIHNASSLATSIRNHS